MEQANARVGLLHCLFLCRCLYAVVRCVTVAGRRRTVCNIDNGQFTHLRRFAVAIERGGFCARVENGQLAQFGRLAVISG